MTINTINLNINEGDGYYNVKNERKPGTIHNEQAVKIQRDRHKLTLRNKSTMRNMVDMWDNNKLNQAKKKKMSSHMSDDHTTNNKEVQLKSRHEPNNKRTNQFSKVNKSRKVHQNVSGNTYKNRFQTAININKQDNSKQVYKSIQLQNRQTTLNTIEKIAGINYKTPTLVAFGKLLYKIPSSYCDTSVDTLKRWKIKAMKMKN